MKQIQGKSVNIEEDIVGRITFEKNIFQRSNEIWVSKDTSSPAFGYVATITTKENIASNSKPYCIVNSVRDFNEGDVVIINKQGEIIFLYEIQSHHNAIMATERCNHRCIMCPQPPVVQEKDKTSFNLKLISLFDKNTQEIGITGGEPTLIGDNLFVLINHIKKKLPKTAISILSNGVKFADKGYAMKLAKCRHHDLQIDIPLFSDIAEEHNRIVGAKTFYKTVQGLYNLALFHQRIGIRIVVHKQTYKRLPQFADYIYHNFPFVAQVAFMQMETTGLAKDHFDQLWIDPYDYNEELREAVLLLADRGMKPYIYNAQLCVLPEDIRCYAQQSISDWKDIYISECDGCVLQGQCAGFFESNRLHHSQHIKPKLNYTPQPKPIDENQSLSAFVTSALTNIDIVGNKVLDIPCGYGRYTMWLAKQGFNVLAVDIDDEAIEYVSNIIAQNGLTDVRIKKKDILNITDSNVCDVLINIHLYNKSFIPIFARLLKKSGVLIIETPENRAGNYMELPKEGELRELLSESFDIQKYKESKPTNGSVSVKVIAIKK